jgi:hypothetical protein
MQVALDAAQNLRLIHVIPEELFEDVIEDEDGGWASGDSDAEETYGPADSDYSDLHSLSDLLLTAFTCGNSGDAEPTASPTAGGPQAARPRPHVLPAHIRKVGVCLKTVDLPSSAPGPTGDAESRSQQRHYLVPDSVFEDEVEDDVCVRTHICVHIHMCIYVSVCAHTYVCKCAREGEIVSG